MEQVAPGTERAVYLVSVDGKPKGAVDFPSSYTPGIAIGEKEVVTWGGTRLYIVPLGSGELRQEEHDDEVEMVYVRSSTWLVVGETSVAVLDPRLRCATSRWAHNEVLTDSWWTDDRLLVKDLGGRTFVVNLDADDRNLTVREAESSD